uniref:Uncharacterized protein n=1 Tax=Panagrolaimus davidi TaxID=227884 RepID=A0A914QGE1_9BILA
MSLNRHLIIYVYCNSDLCQVTSYNLYNSEIKGHRMSSKVSDLRFFDEIQASFNLNNIRAFALNVDCDEFSSFAEYYKLLIRCRDFCQKYGVFFYLSNSILLDVVSAVTQTKTMIKEGEKISIILLISADNEPYYVTLIREKNSYKIFEMGYPEAQSLQK